MPLKHVLCLNCLIEGPCQNVVLISFIKILVSGAQQGTTALFFAPGPLLRGYCSLANFSLHQG